MLTRHSGAAKRFKPSAIAVAALAWPPPVSEVMIRNLWEGSSDILSKVYCLCELICEKSVNDGILLTPVFDLQVGDLLEVAFVMRDNGCALTQRNRRYFTPFAAQGPAQIRPRAISSTAVRAS